MKIFPVMFLLFFSLVACASKAVVKVNPQSSQFTIIEKANPTTGYNWTIKNYNQNLLKLISSHYEGPQEQKPGAGGEMVWVFDVLPHAFQEATTTNIQFVYARPWAPDDHPTVKNYLVVIKP